MTLVGAAGVGKSRLAQEVARAAAPRAGAWLVDLSSVEADVLVATVVADTLGIATDPALPADEAVSRALASSDVLLLLDNAERVLAGCASLVGRLPASCRVLITSRLPLRMPEEAVVEVPPLVASASPVGRGSEALRLLRHRAAAARGVATDDVALDRIARAVGGVPLGLELAAARLATATPADVAAELERRPGAVLAWTVERLTRDEARTFARLAVFRGGFDADAASAVCLSDVRADLASLVRHGLVTVEPGGRFTLLDSVREASQAVLETDDDERAAAHDRHAGAYLELAQRADVRLRGPDATAWLARLDVDRANVRAAAAWALAYRPGTAVRLVAALGWYWYRRGAVQEGLAVADDAFAAAGDLAPAGALAEARLGATGLAYLAGDLPEMGRHLDAAHVAARQSGDAALLARCRLYASWHGALAGDLCGARRAADEGLALARSAGAPDVEAEAHMTLGMLARFSGDLPGAADVLDRARAVAVDCGHAWAEASATWIAGKVALDRGELEQSAGLQLANLKRAVVDADPTGGLVTMHAVAALAVALGRPGDGARLLGAVEALGARIGYHPTRMDPLDAPRYEAAVRHAMSARDHAAAVHAGRLLTLEGAVALARDVLGGV